MKNLVAKAGVAAVTSVLFTSVISVPEAKAIDLVPTRFGTIVYGDAGIPNADGDQIYARTYSLDNPADGSFLENNAVEVGEYVSNETRGYFEFDLTSFLPFDGSDVVSKFTINLNVFSDGGAGARGVGVGGTDLGNSYKSPFNGLVKVSSYFGSALVDGALTFSPPNLTGDCSINFGDDPCMNPLETLNLEAESNAGDSFSLDVSTLVKEILLRGTGQEDPYRHYFGIVLQVEDFDEVGECGINEGRQCDGVTFTAGLKAVPTPAAVLPSLFGLASAAFRKKRDRSRGDA